MTFTGTKQEIQQFLYKLDKETVYDLKIDKHRNKRSIDANSYAWALITEISNSLRMSKEKVYLQMLKDYGQRFMVTMLADVDPSRISKYYEEIGAFKDTHNRVFKKYMFYVGTSEYDSKEMSIFVDGLVQEARQLGIETLEDIEIENLVKEMEKNGMGRY